MKYYVEAKKFSVGREPQFQAINTVSFAAAYLELNAIDIARVCLEKAEEIRRRAHLGIDFSHGEFELDYKETPSRHFIT